MDEITNLVNGLLGLGLDITTAYKQKKGMAGAVDLVLSDKDVVTALTEVITNVSKLPTDFKNINLTDALSLIGPIVRGVEAIVKEAQA